MASGRNGTIYIGATSDPIKRGYEHREGLINGFTKDHGCTLLVWFEAFDDLQEARQRELRMKEWKRPWKIKQIEERNLDWVDLYPTLF
ncbi:MAG: GIY-YIG nuclease family protein [Sphingomonas sp.]|nr:GIY-YIG nuclease family protein [Sphingomonas sp.]